MLEAENKLSIRQQQKGLPQLFRQDVTVRPELQEISLYCFGSISEDCFIAQTERLAKAYPDLDDNFFQELDLATEQKGWDDRKFTDAVTNLIHTFEYKTPNLANLINYDLKIKFYTYDEILAQVIPGVDVFSFYKVVDLDGEMFYIKKAEYIKHNLQLKLWVPKKMDGKPQNLKYPPGMDPKEKTVISVNAEEMAEGFSAKIKTKAPIPVREKYQKPMSPDEIVKAANEERLKKSRIK